MAQTVAASERLSPISDVSFANARSIVSELPGERAVVEIRGVADGDRVAADVRSSVPRGRPDPAVPSVIAMIRSGRFAAMRDAHHRGMHVDAVADELRRHFVGLEDRAGQPGRAVRRSASSR